jgi:hypothetical protein
MDEKPPLTVGIAASGTRGDEFPVSVQVGLPPINAAKMKSPFHPVVAPDSFCAHLGKIAIAWGRFELEFNLFYQTLIEGSAELDKPAAREGLNNVKHRGLVQPAPPAQRTRSDVTGQLRKETHRQDTFTTVPW